MMRKMALHACTAAAIVLSGAVSAAAETIRMGAEGAYPPFNYVAEDGQLKGFDIDIGNAICAELKAECEWSTNEWDGIIPALQAGKFDIIASSMAITKTRMEQVSFSDPYYFNAMRFVALKELNLEEVKPDAVKDLVIGTQSGSIATDMLKDFFPDNEVKLYPTLGEAFLDMKTSRLDLLVESKIAIADWLADGEDCCVFVGEEFLQDGTLGAGLAFRKDDDALRERVNAALAELVRNGTYETIRKAYFDFDIREKPKNASVLFGG
ncbi:transporter substrate-binding domain-containing protein [Shinella granuli]|uniref:Amino acid ABC transporter substrate-binding protein (PAAT family) n=1 Tax=Shinella granuli TaxID=323621 RepID=A0A4R2CX12_SHIGR|nr:transporter substrate-binding domain-containing protein [Shinella granuli]TCN46207.1 amino acid ABC transporter substrate-binding protein (PAAT family) [Shinella granuli]